MGLFSSTNATARSIVKQSLQVGLALKMLGLLMEFVNDACATYLFTILPSMYAILTKEVLVGYHHLKTRHLLKEQG
jgi:hypothetical protein